MKTVKLLTNIAEKEVIHRLNLQFDSIDGKIKWELDKNSQGKIITFKFDGTSKEYIQSKVTAAGIRYEIYVPKWKRIIKNIFRKDCCK